MEYREAWEAAKDLHPDFTGEQITEYLQHPDLDDSDLWVSESGNTGAVKERRQAVAKGGVGHEFDEPFDIYDFEGRWQKAERIKAWHIGEGDIQIESSLGDQ